MHRNIIILSILGLYYALSLYALYTFDAGLLASSVVLFGIPSLILARFTLAPPAVIISVALFGAGIAILFEGIAHIYGLWYTLGVDQVRLLGLIPVEMLFATTIQIIFLALLYEVFFDDGFYTVRSAWQRMVFFVVFAIIIFGLLTIHHFLFDGLFLPYAYYWIIGSVLAAALTVLALHRSLTIQFFDKVIDFSLIASIPLGIMLWISVTNVHKVFALTNEYAYMFPFFGQMVPLEEVLLLFALPFFVGTIYEVYLDDRE